MIEIAIAALACMLAVLGFVLAVVLYVKLRRTRAKYAPIISAEAEVEKLRTQSGIAQRELERFIADSEKQRAALGWEYDKARHTYENLKKEISLLEENLEDISFGLYRPHFDFDASERYKKALEGLRDREREMIRAGGAATCSVKWTVGGSAKDGERMAKQNIKLVLRAFNAECDAALSKVSWNNILQMEERIRKACEAIEKLATVLQVSITDDYFKLKLDELRLTYEYEQKKYQEQEEQRRIREQMREEEKAQREIEKAKEEAEREEARFQKALEKARADAAKASGERMNELNERVRALEAQLEEAHDRKERAVSLAQLTRAGYVYIISNIGSFGEHVYKVGMTRRWDPMDRVKELGDASVPFPFDVHAMIYSEDAPELECALHRFLDERRVNRVNYRKEFFQVTLDEIETHARSRGLTVEFTKIAEAREYRETVSVRSQAHVEAVPAAEAFPANLFGRRAAPALEREAQA